MDPEACDDEAGAPRLAGCARPSRRPDAGAVVTALAALVVCSAPAPSAASWKRCRRRSDAASSSSSNRVGLVSFIFAVGVVRGAATAPSASSWKR